MQHLYGRLAAELRVGSNDAHLLQALHPTPAVCGRPRELALRWVHEMLPLPLLLPLPFMKGVKCRDGMHEP